MSIYWHVIAFNSICSGMDECIDACSTDSTPCDVTGVLRQRSRGTQKLPSLRKDQDMISQGSLDYPFWRNQTIQFYGNLEWFHLEQCIVWVGNIVTPVSAIFLKVCIMVYGLHLPLIPWMTNFLVFSAVESGYLYKLYILIDINYIWGKKSIISEIL